MVYSVSVYDRESGEHLMWCGDFEAATPAAAKEKARARQAQFPISTHHEAVRLPAERVVLRARRTSRTVCPWGR